jgi:Tfp pilus assembly protein PilZ
MTGTFAWAKGVLLNLSAGGAQVYTQAKFASGSEVEIEFITVNTLGKSTKSRLIAKIVWYSGFRYGLQFRKKIKRS